MPPTNYKVSDALKEVLNLDIFCLPAGIKICAKCAHTLRYICEAARKREECTLKFFSIHKNVNQNQLKRPASPPGEQKRARLKYPESGGRLKINKFLDNYFD